MPVASSLYHRVEKERTSLHASLRRRQRCSSATLGQSVSIRGKEMELARSSGSPIVGASRHNRAGIEAPMRRVYLFLIVAIFGAVICENAALVAAGSERADEARNYLRSIGLVKHCGSDGVVMQGSPYTATLQRPMASSLRLSKDEELEEILFVKLKLLRSKASAFRVFINLPAADEETTITRAEFAGSYFHEPRRVKSPDREYQVTIFSIGISDIIKELGLTEQPSILVTFVPCGADKGLPVTLQSLQVKQE